MDRTAWNMTRIAVTGLLALIVSPPQSVYADEAIDHITVEKLAPVSPNRVYVSDVALPHIGDGKLLIIDAQKGKVEGMLATALAGQATRAPDNSEIYVATTYFSRLNHGERHDQVDIYDPASLLLKAEIPIPNKHAQTLNYRGTVRTSSDGRWLLVQNATPATSITVVDLRERKFVAEIPTPGCWIVLPSQAAPNRFASLCGDGTMLVVTLASDGTLQSQKHTKKFFDPDRDPLFVSAVNAGDHYFFVSYRGSIYGADLGSEEPVFDAPWSVVGPADSKNKWRPGGYQPLAIGADGKQLFLAMHSNGKEGSHKRPAKEIWAVDLPTKKRTQRVSGSNAIAITGSQGGPPRLFALDGANGSLVTFDAASRLRIVKRMAAVGETPTQIEAQ